MHLAGVRRILHLIGSRVEDCSDHVQLMHSADGQQSPGLSSTVGARRLSRNIRQFCDDHKRPPRQPGPRLARLAGNTQYCPF